MQAGIDPHRHADDQREQGAEDAEFQGRRHARPDHLDDRFLVLVGDAEIELRRGADETAELYVERVVESQFDPQRFPLLQRGLDTDHLVYRVADIAEHGEGDQRHKEHDDQRLGQPVDRKSEHANDFGRAGRRLKGPAGSPASVLFHVDVIQHELVVRPLRQRDLVALAPGEALLMQGDVTELVVQRLVGRRDHTVSLAGLGLHEHLFG